MSNVAASVRARLLNVAKAQGVDFNQVLVRFALERILYRLCQSEHADRFLLKGALLFTLWYDMPHRATRDADLLGFGASDLESVAQTFRDIGSVAVDDGIMFDPASVIAEEIRKDAGYAGRASSSVASWPRRDARRRSTSASAMRSHRLRWTRSIRCCWMTCLRLACAPIPSTPSSRKSSTPSHCWA